MKTNYFTLILLVILGLNSCKEQTNNKQLTDYIDPYIGTTREGNQIPGPNAPFGMIHPSPINIGKDQPTATNYVFGEKEIHSFGITNMVGVGCGNYGSICVMPTTGDIDFTNYSSEYANETAKAAYYSVDLKSNIKVEMTASERAAVLNFHYPAGEANVLIDLARRASQDSAFMIKKVSDTEIEAYKMDGQFCSAGDKIHHTIYFVAKMNIASEKSGMKTSPTTIDKNVREVKGEDIGAFMSYNFSEPTVLEIKVGISYVSIENARLNLETEIGDKDFKTVLNETEQKWEKLLSRIQVEGKNEKYKKMFYTALFHTMSHPNILNDVNGEYPAMGSHKTMKVKDGDTRFTVFSLWDTYRTLHPFFTLAYPEIQEQMSKSIMGMYKECGWLPQWELISRETHVMVGDPATIVLNDSYLKGIKYDDPETILKAMIHNAEEYYETAQWGYDDVKHIRRSITPYLENNGWIPYDAKQKFKDRLWATVATTQEYNFSDWNISQMAKSLNKEDIAKKFAERSMGYKNLYNPETMFFQQRWADGKWVEPFNPFAGRWPPQIESDKVYDMPWSYSGGPGYCEGMSWHYNFFIPHDIPGVIELMGGGDAFVNRLQHLFDSSYYEATNEPDLAYPFLFNYVKGEEWRTQKIVRHLIEHEYGIGTDGIPGNDDTGTMSAWLIFAMTGFYPDCPGSLDYQLSSPVFDKVTIELNQDYYEGKQFVVKSNSTDENIFINSVTLNGEKYSSFTINHADIVKGGELVFELKEKQ